MLPDQPKREDMPSGSTRIREARRCGLSVQIKRDDTIAAHRGSMPAVTMVVPAMTIGVTINVVVSCCFFREMTQVTAVTIDLHPFRGGITPPPEPCLRRRSDRSGTPAGWSADNDVGLCAIRVETAGSY